MLVPNKITTIKESLLYKVVHIIRNLEDEKDILELYKNTKRYYTDYFEFSDALSVLWILDMVTIDFEEGRVRYVKEY